MESNKIKARNQHPLANNETKTKYSKVTHVMMDREHWKEHEKKIKRTLSEDRKVKQMGPPQKLQVVLSRKSTHEP